MNKTKNRVDLNKIVIRLEAPYEEIKFIPKEKIDYFKKKYNIDLYKFVNKEYRRYMSDEIIKVLETEIFQKPSCEFIKLKKTNKNKSDFYYFLLDKEKYNLKDEVEMLNNTGGLFVYIDKEEPEFNEISTNIMDYLSLYVLFQYDSVKNRIRVGLIDKETFKEIKSLLSNKSSKNGC